MATVKHTFQVSRDKNDKSPVACTVNWDFTGVSTDQLQAIAMKQLTVSVQGTMRNALDRKENKLTWSQSVAQFNGKTVKVAELLKNARGSADPAKRRERVAKDVARMTDAEKKALVALLTKSK